MIAQSRLAKRVSLWALVYTELKDDIHEYERHIRRELE
jgi:hypothetical protein